MPTYELNSLDRDMIRLALRGDVDMRRYIPEVMWLCHKLGLPDPPWFEDEDVRERVALNRRELLPTDQGQDLPGFQDSAS